MATAAVETMQEQSNMIGMIKHAAISQKRGREDELGAGTGADKKWPGWPGDNVFRLLVPVQKVGGIIGRKGEFVKKMCEETRSRIKILEGIPGTHERTVMVSAKEEPEAAISPAMDGILKVHQRIIEGDAMGEFSRGQQAINGMISTRLLVAATQAGSLIGRQGATIKAIQESSGAIVRVLTPDDLPLCSLTDDRLVEVQGEAGNVHKALESIVSHLRRFLVDRSVLPLFELNRTMANQPQIEDNVPHHSWGLGQSSSLSSSGGSGLGNAYQYLPSSLHHESYYPSSDLPPLDSQSHHGLSVYGRDPSLGGSVVGNPPPAAVITQVTQHMQIPLSYADAIIGTAGSNISYMRRTSGATIAIQESKGVPGEMAVEIHGTATQVQTAQQLIQNYMAGAPGPPANTYNSVESEYNSYPTQNTTYSSPQPNNGHIGHSTGGNYNSAGGNYNGAGYGSHYNSNYGY
ncbi:flowering locus K homology domain [Cryptomeria japonica]|uniref:flowering locus K homology domain n=1 Tax=Cryptomeria japonica TaxID=3369 RepID=UPI0027DAAC59|nr:flowering locus K homology domain [Cryptomeria japonica]